MRRARPPPRPGTARHADAGGPHSSVVQQSHDHGISGRNRFPRAEAARIRSTSRPGGRAIPRGQRALGHATAAARHQNPGRRQASVPAPPATRADRLRQLGRSQKSRAAYHKAIELAGNTAEIAYLTRRRDQLG
jgi:hypothetical protein